MSWQAVSCGNVKYERDPPVRDVRSRGFGADCASATPVIEWVSASIHDLLSATRWLPLSGKCFRDRGRNRCRGRSPAGPRQAGGSKGERSAPSPAQCSIGSAGDEVEHFRSTHRTARLPMRIGFGKRDSAIMSVRRHLMRSLDEVDGRDSFAINLTATSQFRAGSVWVSPALTPRDSI